MSALSEDGNVYIISCDELQAFKIGFTRRSPHARLAQLQTGCPVKLRLVGWWPATSDEEFALHEQLRDFRMSGEWFRLADGVNTVLAGPVKMMAVNNILTGHNQ